jgi:hypothetical protein
VDTCIWSKTIGRNVTASRKPGTAPLDCKGRNTASTTPTNTTSLIENRGERPLKFPSRSKFELESSDQIILYCDGQVDKVRWSSGWAETGSAMGVDGGKVDTSKNDDLDNWCAQGGFLSNGDYGNPGYGNDWCF